eukprot:8599815-Alexandrium_andersonii.AAC.1
MARAPGGAERRCRGSLGLAGDPRSPGRAAPTAAHPKGGGRATHILRRRIGQDLGDSLWSASLPAAIQRQDVLDLAGAA